MLPVVECCAPLLEEPINEANATQLAGWFRVLGNPIRLRLLSLIAAQREACVACELVDPLGVSQPTISHHLKVLFEAGLVDREKRGRYVLYRPRARTTGDPEPHVDRLSTSILGRWQFESLHTGRDAVPSERRSRRGLWPT